MALFDSERDNLADAKKVSARCFDVRRDDSESCVGQRGQEGACQTAMRHLGHAILIEWK